MKTDSFHRQEQVLATMTDYEGNPTPWLAAEELGYSEFVKDLTVRQIVGALQALKRKGLVKHSGGCEWKLTDAGFEATKTGLQR